MQPFDNYLVEKNGFCSWSQGQLLQHLPHLRAVLHHRLLGSAFRAVAPTLCTQLAILDIHIYNSYGFSWMAKNWYDVIGQTRPKAGGTAIFGWVTSKSLNEGVCEESQWVCISTRLCETKPAERCLHAREVSLTTAKSLLLYTTVKPSVCGSLSLLIPSLSHNKVTPCTEISKLLKIPPVILKGYALIISNTLDVFFEMSQILYRCQFLFFNMETLISPWAVD